MTTAETYSFESSAHDSAVAEVPSTGSMLEQLTAELKTPLPKDILDLHLPERSHIVLSYDTRIDTEKTADIVEQSRSGEKLNMLKVHALTLALANTKITMNGKPLQEDGQFVTLRSQSFVDGTGAIGQFEAIKVLFGRDADISSHYLEIQGANAFDRTGKAAPDPTVLSID